MLKNKPLEEYLNEVDYNKQGREHTEFTWKFITFIQAIKGNDPTFDDIPEFHLDMLDRLTSKKRRLVNICHRGSAKTTLFGLFLLIYLAVFNRIDGFGVVNYGFYVCDSKNSANEIIRKNIQRECETNKLLQEYLPLNKQKFTEDTIEFENREGGKLIIDLFGAGSGIRGRQKLGVRPQLIIFDDIITDEAARSKVMMQNLRDLVHGSVEYAVDPKHYKLIFNGTPFHKQDVLYEAVESGVWEVNAFPVCTKFPCSKEEFNGSWPTRFSYEVVEDKYNAAYKQKKVGAFQREMMLRILDEEDRLVPDEYIITYDYDCWFKHKDKYTYYITTDFAVSDKKSADYSVISVWAYSSDGEYLLVDGVSVKQTMDKVLDLLFEFVSIYKPKGVGIENTGQQQGIISWIFQEMRTRKLRFPLIRHGRSIGVRPVGDKFSRFNIIASDICRGIIKFPSNAPFKPFFYSMNEQIKSVSVFGIKGHDDILDTVSMLQYIRPSKPEAKHNYHRIANVYKSEPWWKKLVVSPKKTDETNSYIGV